MALLTVYGLLASWIVTTEHLKHIEWGAESTVLNGVVLGFLIAFRNNNAYARWWDARALWGELINQSRNLCLKVRSLAHIDAAEREAMGRLVTEFGYALKDHLRWRGRSELDLAGPEEDQARAHQPIRVTAEIYEAVLKWNREGHLDGWGMLWLEGQVKSLMDICGACEKIRNTPLPSSYRALLRHGLALYLAITPFYLIEDIGISGLPMFLLAAYFLLGIELVAEEIEEPFGAGGDNLALERYCATIEASVREILGTPVSHRSTVATDGQAPEPAPLWKPGTSR
jgi:putative membrane protein